MALSSTLPPKRRTKVSKKNKSSWRKNTDIEKVEEFLEDQRFEERVGLKEKKFEDLFQIDNEGGEHKTDAAENVNKKNRLDKPLKCFQHLEIKSGVKDPKENRRNRRKTKEERQNPIAKQQAEEDKLKGKLKARTVKSAASKLETIKQKQKTLLDRRTRRRTKFDFDLWGGESKQDKEIKQVQGNEWLDSTVKRHNLKEMGKWQVKAPADLFETPSTADTIETPHSGASYNPSYEDHKDLIWKAAMVEMNKEKEKLKIERQTTDMFPKTNKQELEKNYIKEMSVGIKSLEKEFDEKETNDDEEVKMEEEEEEEDKEGEYKPKTKKQRRKETRVKSALRKRLIEAQEKKKEQDVFRLKKMKKLLVAQEKFTAAKMRQRRREKEVKRGLPARLTTLQYEEPEMDLKLSDELTSNLISIKPEGNLLHDRFKSLQKRNVIEPTIKRRMAKRKWKKRYVKKGFR